MAWGHPQTSGLPTIDVFLSSELMEPPDGAGHYTEQLLPLPGIGTYYIPLEVDPAPVDWQAWGVDPDRVLYLCAQSLFKYLPQYDEVFPRIARKVGKCQFLEVSISIFAGPPLPRDPRALLAAAATSLSGL
ncbi:hypothetical protein [Thermostichus sp. MS-CIW-37]